MRHALVPACLGLLLAIAGWRTGTQIAVDLEPAIRTATSTGVPSRTFSRERALELAMQAAKSSAPDVGIIEARLEAIAADLIDRDEVARRGGMSELPSAIAQVWWVSARGYFRYEGMPRPGGKPLIYEADERVFLYEAATGRPLGGLIPRSRPAGKSPTPNPSPPAVATAASAGAGAPGPQPAATPLPVRIAFERAGDIYLLETATGDETRLTDDGRNRAPRWASDGHSLFFDKGPAASAPICLPTSQPATVSVTENWRWRPGMGVDRLPDGMRSPDGVVLATVEPTQALDQAEVVWVEKAGRRVQVTPAEAGVFWRPLAWGPDEQQLALARYEPEPHLVKDGTVTYCRATVWVTDGDVLAGVRRELPMPPTFRGEPGVPDTASWSPDGRFLTLGVGPAMPCASCRADGLLFYALPTQGGTAIELGSAVLPTGAPSWAMTNAFVVLSEPFGRETYANKHLVRVDPTSGGLSSLAEDQRYADLEPAVSPDARQVAFARGWAQVNGVPQGPVAPDLHPNVATIASRRLWLVDADGSSARQLLDDPGWTDEAPVWSPDGAWILFVRWRPPAKTSEGVAELWTVRPDGSAAKRLVADLARYDIGTGFGYYGAFRWREMFAVTPN